MSLSEIYRMHLQVIGSIKKARQQCRAFAVADVNSGC